MYVYLKTSAHGAGIIRIIIPDREYASLDTWNQNAYNQLNSRSGIGSIQLPDREWSEVKAECMDIARISAAKIGEFVRERRTTSNLTQQELGELAGVGTRLVSELERGKPTLRMDAVNKVLHVFGRMLSHAEAPREENDREEP
jgi:y4mF family transcriptional regulator